MFSRQAAIVSVCHTFCAHSRNRNAVCIVNSSTRMSHARVLGLPGRHAQPNASQFTRPILFAKSSLIRKAYIVVMSDFHCTKVGIVFTNEIQRHDLAIPGGEKGYSDLAVALAIEEGVWHGHGHVVMNRYMA
ncbi:hypothetical protein M8J76_006543 [Diaphorina citri]|nr:hypothetical protein M8J76_006543 [Diaphorina citri]